MFTDDVQSPTTMVPSRDVVALMVQYKEYPHIQGCRKAVCDGELPVCAGMQALPEWHLLGFRHGTESWPG